MTVEPQAFDENNSKPLDTEREKIIDEILRYDERTFAEWAKDRNNFRKLEIPSAVFRALLVTEKILQLSENPSNVDVVLATSTSKTARALVVEHKAQPVSNEQLYKAYLAIINRIVSRSESVEIWEEKTFPNAPESIDKFHLNNGDLIESGKLSLYDQVFFEIELRKTKPYIVHVDNYLDREELRRRGIGQSVFKALENFRSLGFRFITGHNNETNVSFFTSRIGRSTLDQINRTDHHIFSRNGKMLTRKELFTIQFLFPEDANKFLAK